MAMGTSMFFVIGTCMMCCTFSHGYDHLNSFTGSLLREVMNHMSNAHDVSNDLELPSLDEFPMSLKDDQMQESSKSHIPKDYDTREFSPRHDDSVFWREPSIRDQEYLEHSSLFGHQYVQGGAGEGFQRLKPDGSLKNVQVVKTDRVLPAYCNPPNPCPLGYTAADGCIEDFENTAAFSRDYQASQDCMCDTEHMFDCPGTSRDSEIDALARSIQNEGLMDNTINRIVENMQIEGEHKDMAAKKFMPEKATNPFLVGEKLPVIAKKAPTMGKYM